VTALVIRAAAPEDAAGIARVHVESWRAAYPGIVPQAVLDNLSVERRATFWAGQLSNPGDSRTWVAEEGDAIVGFVGTRPPDVEDAADLPPGIVELATIYVLPDAVGRGVGRALMERALSELAAGGAAAAFLWVFKANERARRFYEAAGWTVDDTARDLDLGGEAIPIVRYRVAMGTG
jgi:ribosomal protein S18 acetylase RimI-like enzyme